MHKVLSTIQGINNPLVFWLFLIALGHACFFTQEAVIRVGVFQDVYNGDFCSTVNVRYIVAGAFAGDLNFF